MVCANAKRMNAPYLEPQEMSEAFQKRIFRFHLLLPYTSNEYR
jgi:hypothetical protein